MSFSLQVQVQIQVQAHKRSNRVTPDVFFSRHQVWIILSEGLALQTGDANTSHSFWVDIRFANQIINEFLASKHIYSQILQHPAQPSNLAEQMRTPPYK